MFPGLSTLLKVISRTLFCTMFSLYKDFQPLSGVTTCSNFIPQHSSSCAHHSTPNTLQKALEQLLYVHNFHIRVDLPWCTSQETPIAMATTMAM